MLDRIIFLNAVFNYVEEALSKEHTTEAKNFVYRIC